MNSETAQNIVKRDAMEGERDLSRTDRTTEFISVSGRGRRNVRFLKCSHQKIIQVSDLHDLACDRLGKQPVPIGTNTSYIVGWRQIQQYIAKNNERKFLGHCLLFESRSILC